MKKTFEEMTPNEFLNYINDNDFGSSYEKIFREEVIGYKNSKEIEFFFRKTKLKGEKGWKLIDTFCEYSREHENYKCPADYYLITAKFKKVG